MRVTLNAMEMAGLSSATRDWETKTGEKASVEFVLTMISGFMSEDLGGYIERAFDTKTKILEDAERENRQ